MYQAVVFVHIVAAIVWVGSMFFLALVLVPVLRGQPPQQRAALMAAVGRRLRLVGWVALVTLLATGVWNLRNRGFSWDELASGGVFEGEFGSVLGMKLGLVGVTLLISSTHDFVLGPRSAAIAQAGGPDARVRAEAMRRRASWLARVNLLVALGILWLAVALVRGLP